MDAGAAAGLGAGAGRGALLLGAGRACVGAAAGCCEFRPLWRVVPTIFYDRKVSANAFGKVMEFFQILSAIKCTCHGCPEPKGNEQWQGKPNACSAS